MVPVVNKIINSINTYDPTIDTSEGSNFRDLLINPLSLLLQEYELQIAGVLQRTAALNLESLTDEELEALGTNYLVQKSAGTPATGKIRIYFRAPQAITIAAGTKISDSEGRVFKLVNGYAISRLQMDFNLGGDGLYSTGDIDVISDGTGSDYLREQGDTFSFLYQPQFTRPVKILAIENFTGGNDGDSRDAFIQKIRNTVLSKSTASSASLGLKVLELNENILSAEVVGAGSPFMLRDLTSRGIEATVSENYLYTYSGQWLESYSKGHIAYVDNFFQASPSGVISWPAPSGWKSEFTDLMYDGLYYLDDTKLATKDQYQIISIQTWDSEQLALFEKADAKNRDRSLVYVDEIKVNNNLCVIGKQFEEGEEIQARVSSTDLASWNADLAEAVQKGDWATVKNISELLSFKTSPEELTNISPVMYKEINQHTGIDIETSITTSDMTEEGEMCYITVLRNTVLTLPHDGYGLAWRKQPQYMIRLDEDSYTDQALRAADVARFEEEWGVNPDTIGLSGNLSDPANSTYWKYNVYLVDNDILQEETYVPFETMLDLSSGKNQFLQMAKMWIVPEVSYDFKIRIYPTLATQAWIKPSSVSDFTDIDHLVIDRGAIYPNYVPASGEKIINPAGVEILDSTKGAFGIGVGETRGYAWTISELFVRSFVQTFPMHLFKMNIDLTKWNLTDSFQINWWGYGWDPNIPDAGAAEVAIYNPGTEEWESIGENLANPSSNPDLKLITSTLETIGNYIINNGNFNWVYIAASAKNFGPSFSGHIDHNLVTHYIEILNPLTESFHKGNCVDVWCYAPSELKTFSQDYTADPQDAFIELEIPYLSDIIELREAYSQEAVPEAEWYLFNSDKGDSWGPNSKVKIIFDSSWAGALVTVVYKAWSSGDYINSVLNSDDIRYPATSVQAKVAPLWILEFDRLEYSGSLPVENAREIIKTWVWETTTFEKSDLVNLLYSGGATYVNLDMDINVKKYNTSFYHTTESLTAQRLELPDTLTRFYTSDEYLIGVTNV